jgi:hypothetical protein
MAAALSTVLGVGSELGATNNDSAIVTALRRGSTDSLKPDRPAGRAPQPQYPADHHHPAGISGPRHRQSRSRPGALPELSFTPVAKLKLSAIPDDRPVKLTVELPAAVHRDLVAYAEALGRETGQSVEMVKLIPPMLARFMSTDRAFLRARREKQGMQ